MPSTGPMTGPSAAARWLIAEYEATDPYWVTLHSELDADGECVTVGTVCLQPMFGFKDLTDDTGEPMCVSAGDYQDPGRWWL